MSANRDSVIPKILQGHIAVHGSDTLRGTDQRMPREELFNRSVPFAIGVASKYRSYGVDHDDLVQQSLLGLWVATEKFDPDNGSGFLTYAKWWCLAYIQEALAEFTTPARIPRHAWVAATKARRAAGPGGMDPRDMGDAVYAVEMLGRGSISMDYEKDGVRPLAESLGVPASALEDQDERDMATEVERYLGALPERSAYVVRECFGLGGNEPRTLESISADLGITREGVRQVRNAALDFLSRKADKINRGERIAMPVYNTKRIDDSGGTPACPRCNGTNVCFNGASETERHGRCRMYICTDCLCTFVGSTKLD